MDASCRRKRFSHRSRTSCLECRRAHRKCDESRPACTRCSHLAQPCTYGLRILWRPRLSSRSNFGQQFDDKDSRRRASEQHGGSPLALGSLDPTRPSPPGQSCPSLLAKPVALFPDLSPAHRSLLAYFTHAADSFSCDHGIKDQLCGVFIPMAAVSGPLMASILALASVHRANNATLFQDARELGALQLTSVRQLRLRLSKPPDETVVAAALMLCFAQIMSGGSSSSSSSSDSSWRLHLEGVSSLFAADALSWSVYDSSPSKALICKCFVSLAALANVSGQPPSRAVSQRALDMLGRDVSRHYVDDFTAYSTELMHVLFEIGDLLRERHRVLADAPRRTTNVALAGQAAQLLHRLTAMAIASRARIDYSNPRHRDVDELFHLAAMLLVSQRLNGLLPSSAEIQQLTAQMLSRLRGIKLHDGPGIGVLLFFPAFTAGTGAVDASHRLQIRDLLNDLVRTMGFINLRQGLDVLEALWAHRDLYGESDVNASWECFVGRVDIILY